MSNLLVPQRCQLVWSRFYFPGHNKKHIYKAAGNEQRYNNIRFYPKDKSHVDPPVTDPPKLFRVQRILPMKGLPYWERRLLNDLGLKYNAGTDVAIVKNIPENNARLWKIKHLISVEPITFPYGEPTKDDINHSFLKLNGECVVTKKIEIDPKRLKAAEDYAKDKTVLDKETLQREALLRWVRHY